MNLLDSIRKYSKTKMLFVFGIFFIVIGGILLLPKAFASPIPVKSVTIESSKLDYSKKEPGSYNIEKSAQWIAKGKARITFDLDTVMKSEKKNTDIIFVLDVSGSMEGDKLNRVKQDSIELINTLLSDSNNRAALITFETVSKLMISLTNNKEELVSTINGLTTGNTTNYYQALVNVNEILKDYEKKEDRDCIVLFLTDGYPNEDVPNEEGEYSYLKKAYPYITINGIQYEMVTDVLQPIKKVSDSQFIADMTNLNNVLFEASVAPSTYNEFLITDYIDNDYFEIDGIESIVASTGSIKLEYEDSVPKVIWDIENLRSGGEATLTIDVNLKMEYIDKGGLYPTNKKEEVKSKIDEVIDDIVSTNTPILSSHYQVIYDGNAPESCIVKNVPITTNKSVFETVEISNNVPVCEGYQFKGWELVTEKVKRINDDYFTMPSFDVVLRAEWSSISISKAMEGEIYVAPPSVMRRVRDYDYDDIWNYKSSIIKVVFENRISDKNGAIATFDISDKKDGSVMGYIVPNGDSSTYTAYIQGNGKVIANKNSFGVFSRFSKLITIEGLEYFDTSQVTNMSSMFSHCSSLTDLDLSHFETSNVIDMSRMFFSCNSLTVLDVSSFDTGKVTNMTYMFDSCNKLTSLNLSSLNTSNVINMSNMFSNCSKLVDINLSNLDTSKVTTMASMFYQCSSLTNLDLSGLDTSNVTNMEKLFYKCGNLFNINLFNFDTSKVRNMSYMFYSCSSLPSLDLSSFDTSNVTNMSYMFYDLDKITNIDLHDFNTSNVIYMTSMFANCSGLTMLDVGFLNTSNVIDMDMMFSGCSKLVDINLSSFDTSKVATMYAMFSGCSSLVNLDLSNFSTGQVTDMSRMFFDCKRLVSINLSNFNTSSVTTMANMFFYCTSLLSLDLGDFDTSKVTNMKGMFQGCSSLISLDLSGLDTGSLINMENIFTGCSGLIELKLDGFNTSKVTNMKDVFSYCKSLRTIDLSNFDTSNVINMYGMFHECSSLTSLDLSNLNTVKVKDMGYMFDGCSSLINLDLSNFNTSQVTTMYNMFYNCSSLTSLDLSNFNTSQVTTMYGMFSDCSSLISLDLSNFDTSQVTSMEDMFLKCSNLAALDLSDFNTGKVTNMRRMFYLCSALTNLNLGNFDTSSVVTVKEMFIGCARLNTFITIMNGGISSYDKMFSNVATETGAKVIVNYILETSDLVDEMIATKSSSSNVVKGELKS